MKHITILSGMLAIFALCGCNDDKIADQELSHYQNESFPETGETVTFAVFGNTGRATGSGRTFDRLIAELNKVDISFAIDLGNCLPPGIPPEGAEVIRNSVDAVRSSFDMPVYPVAGPLDIFDPVSSSSYMNRYGSLWYGFTYGTVHFIILSTEDKAYSEGFGNQPRLGNEQLDWLRNEIDTLPGDMPIVLIMNRPVWDETPYLWHNRLVPMLGSARIALALSCSDKGLRDWGNIDGIHAISTGCTDPVSETGPGCFPHMLIVTMNNHKSSFRILEPDGTITDGIEVTTTKVIQTDEIASQLMLRPLRTDPGFNISETITLTVNNLFDTSLEGMISFDVSPSTQWEIRPLNQPIVVDAGERETVHIQVAGTAPELGPLPRYRITADLGRTPLADRVEDIILDIPRPRTGEVVTVKAAAPELIPWDFNGSTVHIPVDIGSIDTCGRLIIYREDTPVPECVYISALVDFRPGISDFTWDGLDLDGEPVTGGDLAYYLFAYNKTAPVTWVAEGPPAPGGTITVGRDLAGLGAETHTDSSIVSYPFDESISGPEPVTVQSIGNLLGGLSLIGFAHGDEGRLYLGTQYGIMSTVVREGTLLPDSNFGDNGFYRLNDLRERAIGVPVYRNGRLYLGVGGGNGGGPLLLLIDGVTGKLLSRVELGSYFGLHEAPPAVTVTGQGVYLAHPDERLVMHMTHYGDIIWMNDSGDSRIGAVGTDGRSFTYGIGVDQYGFTYVGTPGTSARCGILGPDGRGLFRVILVQAPGLRVAQALPLIEERDSDGLYIATYGATRPYLFHVPFTIRRGRIVHTAETFNKDSYE